MEGENAPFVFYQSAELLVNMRDDKLEGKTQLWIGFRSVLSYPCRIFLHTHYCNIDQVLVDGNACEFTYRNPFSDGRLVPKMMDNVMDTNIRVALEIRRHGELEILLPPNTSSSRQAGLSKDIPDGLPTEIASRLKKANILRQGLGSDRFLRVDIAYKTKTSPSVHTRGYRFRRGSEIMAASAHSNKSPHPMKSLAECFYTVSGRSQSKIHPNFSGVRSWLPTIDSPEQRAVFDLTIRVLAATSEDVVGGADSSHNRRYNVKCTGQRVLEKFYGVDNSTFRFITPTRVPAASLGVFVGSTVEKYRIPLYKASSHIWVVILGLTDNWGETVQEEDKRKQHKEISMGTEKNYAELLSEDRGNGLRPSGKRARVEATDLSAGERTNFGDSTQMNEDDDANLVNVSLIPDAEEEVDEKAGSENGPASYISHASTSGAPYTLQGKQVSANGRVADCVTDSAYTEPDLVMKKSIARTNLHQQAVRHTTLCLDVALRHIHKFTDKKYDHSNYVQIFVPELGEDFIAFDGFSLVDDRFLHAEDAAYLETAAHLIQITAYLYSWLQAAISTNSYACEFILHGVIGYLTQFYVDVVFGEDSARYRLQKALDCVIALEKQGDAIPLVSYLPEQFDVFSPFYAQYVVSKSLVLFTYIEEKLGGTKDAMRLVLKALIKSAPVSRQSGSSHIRGYRPRASSNLSDGSSDNRDFEFDDGVGGDGSPSGSSGAYLSPEYSAGGLGSPSNASVQSGPGSPGLYEGGGYYDAYSPRSPRPWDLLPQSPYGYISAASPYPYASATSPYPYAGGGGGVAVTGTALGGGLYPYPYSYLQPSAEPPAELPDEENSQTQVAQDGRSPNGDVVGVVLGSESAVTIPMVGDNEADMMEECAPNPSVVTGPIAADASTEQSIARPSVIRDSDIVALLVCESIGIDSFITVLRATSRVATDLDDQFLIKHVFESGVAFLRFGVFVEPKIENKKQYMTLVVDQVGVKRGRLNPKSGLKESIRTRVYEFRDDWVTEPVMKIGFHEQSHTQEVHSKAGREKGKRRKSKVDEDDPTGALGEGLSVAQQADKIRREEEKDAARHSLSIAREGANKVRFALLDPCCSLLAETHVISADSMLVEQLFAEIDSYDLLRHVQALRSLARANPLSYPAAARTVGGGSGGDVVVGAGGVGSRRFDKNPALQVKALTDCLLATPIGESFEKVIRSGHSIYLRIEASLCLARWQNERAPDVYFDSQMQSRGARPKASEASPQAQDMRGPSWAALRALTNALYGLYIDHATGLPLASDFGSEASSQLRSALLLSVASVRSRNARSHPDAVDALLLFAENHVNEPVLSAPPASLESDPPIENTQQQSGDEEAIAVKLATRMIPQVGNDSVAAMLLDDSHYRATLLLGLSKIAVDRLDAVTSSDKNVAVMARIREVASGFLRADVAMAKSKARVGSDSSSKRPITLSLDGAVVAAALLCLSSLDLLATSLTRQTAAVKSMKIPSGCYVSKSGIMGPSGVGFFSGVNYLDFFAPQGHKFTFIRGGGESTLGVISSTSRSMWTRTVRTTALDAFLRLSLLQAHCHNLDRKRQQQQQQQHQLQSVGAVCDMNRTPVFVPAVLEAVFCVLQDDAAAEGTARDASLALLEAVQDRPPGRSVLVALSLAAPWMCITHADTAALTLPAYDTTAKHSAGLSTGAGSGSRPSAHASRQGVDYASLFRHFTFTDRKVPGVSGGCTSYSCLKQWYTNILSSELLDESCRCVLFKAWLAVFGLHAPPNVSSKEYATTVSASGGDAAHKAEDIFFDNLLPKDRLNAANPMENLRTIEMALRHGRSFVSSDDDFQQQQTHDDSVPSPLSRRARTDYSSFEVRPSSHDESQRALTAEESTARVEAMDSSIGDGGANMHAAQAARLQSHSLSSYSATATTAKTAAVASEARDHTRAGQKLPVLKLSLSRSR